VSAGVSTTYVLPVYSDPEGGIVTLFLVTGPTFATLSGNSIIINPSLLISGTTITTVSLSDGVNGAVAYNFNIIVTNLSPSFTTVPVV
jgi:hypothetical protein